MRKGEILTLPRKAALRAAGCAVVSDTEYYEEPSDGHLWLRVGILGVVGML